MPQQKAFSILLVVVLLAALIVSCGTSSNSNRVLQSMAVTPASADANNSPNGLVQFTATGMFSKSPSPAPVTFTDPYSGSWLVDSTMATLVGTGNGTATFKCVGGASGTTKVTAVASANSGMGTKNSSIAVSGTARLTCP